VVMLLAREELKKAFERDGYIILPGLLDGYELAEVEKALKEDESVVKHAFELNDSQGLKSRLSLWNQPGEDITGMIARCHKVASTMEDLLGGEVYHYHTKLMMKEAKTGGAFVWHQDYGYWYNNGCMTPNMGTVFIAIDQCLKINGCLQVLKGSHHLGRIDHLRIGGQTGADLERVDQAMKMFELVYVELQPGDALFFHSNLLHKSDQNVSDLRRYAFLIAYNRADNNPYKVHHHPQYVKLDKVPDSAIRECKSKETKGKDFMDPKTDKTIALHDYH